MTPDFQLPNPEFFMHRCLGLAKLGAGYVAPNPMVGAVLVYKEVIIGEGYHKKFGQAHAEVNCINSVKEEDRKFISDSVLYVSLEPCAHVGKTPPCTDLIIKNKISKVVIGSRDPNKEITGGGCEKLLASGIEVTLLSGKIEQECKELNKPFFTFYTKHRPYIVLKWAETSDRKIADEGLSRLQISDEQTNRLVHKWRSEESSILVGTHTALFDDPALTTRLWPGPSPVRMVVDLDLKLPSTLQLFNGEQRTIIFNKLRHLDDGNNFYYQLPNQISLVREILKALYDLKIQSVIVEGGAKLLQSFINEGMWDEVRRIRNTKLKSGNGLAAPELPQISPNEEITVQDDIVNTYFHSQI